MLPGDVVVSCLELDVANLGRGKGKLKELAKALPAASTKTNNPVTKVRSPLLFIMEFTPNSNFGFRAGSRPFL